jgi:hypothetical protein
MSIVGSYPARRIGGSRAALRHTIATSSDHRCLIHHTRVLNDIDQVKPELKLTSIAVAELRIVYNIAK